MAARQPVAPPRFGGGRDSRPDRGTLLDAAVRWPRPERLDEPVRALSGIGPVLAGQAAAAGVRRLDDLLWRLPHGLGETPGSRLLAELEPGEDAIVLVTVERSRRVRVRRRGMSVIEATVSDDSGSEKAVWFNQPWMAGRLRPGSRFLLEGRPGPHGFAVAAAEPASGATGGRPETSPPISWNSAGVEVPPEISSDGPRVRRPGGGGIGSGRWRRWTFEACRAAVCAGDPVPAALLAVHGFPGRAAALREAHFPAGEARRELALKRLAWEELLLHRAMLTGHRRDELSAAPPAPVLEPRGSLPETWISGLPFSLTGDQSAAISVIREELASAVPMRRLLMGEVGSGKTVVAMAAVVQAAASGAQSALMAPTGVLAGQHADTAGKLLAPAGLKVGLLTGSTGKKERERLLAAAEDGSLDLLIGTHALLEPDVRFRRLALAVVDEEHRFGVRQRARLESAGPPGESAHLLHLSATPIPRTLALTAYGDLDVTALRELPAGRSPVVTELVRETGRPEIFARVRKELDRGRQAFVVCPLIDDSGELEARAAETEAARLAEGELAGYEVGLIHGRMAADRKQRAMAAFCDGRIQALVSTTVIEVGIDVPNASVMVIEGAERFGLSQLHQLRGRVGRGEHGGTCFLVQAGGGARASRRLGEMVRSSDGFRLAELDLEMRGEGETAGTRQHGMPRFAVARLPRDAALLDQADRDLSRLGDGPDLDLLARAARARFGSAGAESGRTGENDSR